MNAEPVLLSWSGGKDSALALDRLQRNPAFNVLGLLTTVTSEYDRVSIHGVRRALLHAQGRALGLPVHEIVIPPQSSNSTYEAAWSDALRSLPLELSAARCIAFGDIFLEDVRAYRESMARALGFRPEFPLWGESTSSLAAEVIGARYAVRVVCVDTHALSADFAGRMYDQAFIDDLPAAADPCGERGEFHTFVSDGPSFRVPVRCRVGEVVVRDERFAFCDLHPPDAEPDVCFGSSGHSGDPERHGRENRSATGRERSERGSSSGQEPTTGPNRSA